MNLEIMDYDDKKIDTGVCIDNIDNSGILSIDISVITGDEVADIVWADGFDGSYTIYAKDKLNVIDDFNKRKNSYWFKYYEFPENY